MQTGTSPASSSVQDSRQISPDGSPGAGAISYPAITNAPILQPSPKETVLPDADLLPVRDNAPCRPCRLRYHPRRPGGDGDLILLRPDGTLVFPLPRDPVLAGNETHSLSAPDAHLLWRTATIDRGEGGVLLVATDGISDSFAGSESEEFALFVHSLVDRIRTYGTDSVASAMSGWLDRYSEIASGDDMTLVYASINPEHHEEPDTGSQDNGKPVPGEEAW